jgi:hypothetical protein
MAEKRTKKHRRKPGRPRTGQDPVTPVRLPAKLLRDIDAWRVVFDRMDRSAAIRSLIVFGLQTVAVRAIDPKGNVAYEGDTPPLLKFYGRAIKKWTPKPQKPSAIYEPRFRRAQPPTRKQVVAIADRAAARSKQRP